MLMGTSASTSVLPHTILFTGVSWFGKREIGSSCAFIDGDNGAKKLLSLAPIHLKEGFFESAEE